jgi:hypothetical protein
MTRSALGMGDELHGQAPLPPALAGVELKLGRAAHHLAAIKDEVARFDYGPDVIPGEYDAQTRTHVFRAQHDPPPPTALSARIGEFLYNVRCALDYIVVELITLAGNPVDRKKAFPIYTDPAAYANSINTKIGGVPAEATPRFERLQPFYGPNSNPLDPRWRDPEKEPLAVLQRLNNRDKHRTLTLIESIGSIEPEFPNRPDVLAGEVRVRRVPLKRGAAIAAFAPGALDPDVEVNLTVAFHIGIDEGESAPVDLVQTFDQILRVVSRRVVPEFAPFLPD